MYLGLLPNNDSWTVIVVYVNLMDAEEHVFFGY